MRCTRCSPDALDALATVGLCRQGFARNRVVLVDKTNILRVATKGKALLHPHQVRRAHTSLAWISRAVAATVPRHEQGLRLLAFPKMQRVLVPSLLRARVSVGWWDQFVMHMSNMLKEEGGNADFLKLLAERNLSLPVVDNAQLHANGYFRSSFVHFGDPAARGVVERSRRCTAETQTQTQTVEAGNLEEEGGPEPGSEPDSLDITDASEPSFSWIHEQEALEQEALERETRQQEVPTPAPRQAPQPAPRRVPPAPPAGSPPPGQPVVGPSSRGPRSSTPQQTGLESPPESRPESPVNRLDSPGSRPESPENRSESPERLERPESRPQSPLRIELQQRGAEIEARLIDLIHQMVREEVAYYLPRLLPMEWRTRSMPSLSRPSDALPNSLREGRTGATPGLSRPSDALPNSLRRRSEGMVTLFGRSSLERGRRAQLDASRTSMSSLGSISPLFGSLSSLSGDSESDAMLASAALSEQPPELQPEQPPELQPELQPEQPPQFQPPPPLPVLQPEPPPEIRQPTPVYPGQIPEAVAVSLVDELKRIQAAGLENHLKPVGLRSPEATNLPPTPIYPRQAMIERLNGVFVAGQNNLKPSDVRAREESTYGFVRRGAIRRVVPASASSPSSTIVSERPGGDAPGNGEGATGPSVGATGLSVSRVSMGETPGTSGVYFTVHAEVHHAETDFDEPLDEPPPKKHRLETPI
jgi:hypothetical protein